MGYFSKNKDQPIDEKYYSIISFSFLTVITLSKSRRDPQQFFKILQHLLLPCDEAQANPTAKNHK